MFVLETLLFATAALVLCTAFAGTLLFRYENANGAPGRIPAPAGGIARCLFQFIRTLAEHLLCICLLPFGPVIHRLCEREIPRTPADNDSELPPLVLIHGFCNNASCWLYSARVLKKRRFRVRVFSYSPFEAPEQIVVNLTAFLRGLELPGGNRPLFVTHSMGGLIARLFLLGAPDGACGLITLGTPHAGSKIAAMFFGKQARGLTPGSYILTRLARAPRPGIPCVSLAVTADEAVLPPVSLEPPEGWGLRISGSVAGHYGMLFCPRAAAELVEETERIAASYAEVTGIQPSGLLPSGMPEHPAPACS